METPKKKSGEEKTLEYRKKEIMYIRHRIQKSLLDKSGKEPDPDVFTLLLHLPDYRISPSSLRI